MKFIKLFVTTIIVSGLLCMFLASAFAAEDTSEPAEEAIEGSELGRTEITAQSGTLVRYRPEPKRVVLKINPELSLGGMFSNYRDLGNFAYVNFGGGIGFTFLEDWHFKLNVWAMTETHQYKSDKKVTSGAPLKYESDHQIWFVQPSVYAYYRLAHFKEHHYFIPMDLFLGIRLGANIFLVDIPFGDRDDEANFLYGIALMPRFFVWKNLGVAPLIELTTIDYGKNFFFQFGASIFWDFEVLEKK